MNQRSFSGRASPSITTMIRSDHSHVLLTAHKFRPETSSGRKRAIVDTIRVALQAHATMEEEIFYPALRQAGLGGEVLDKSAPEHDEMRRLLDRLEDMEPQDPRYDDTFHSLMREVTHHMADEENVLLPLAEKHLADRLGELGARMTRRRMQLIGPQMPRVVADAARTSPVGTMLVTGGLLAGAYLLVQAMSPGSNRSRSEGRWTEDYDADEYESDEYPAGYPYRGAESGQRDGGRI